MNNKSIILSSRLRAGRKEAACLTGVGEWRGLMSQWCYKKLSGVRFLGYARNDNKKNFSTPLGFTLAEVVVVIGVLIVLVGVGMASLIGTQNRASLTTTIDVFIADLKEQQVKAMVGDTEGDASLSTYGIFMETSRYTLFRGTYVAGNGSNFTPSFTSTIQINNTFPSAQIVFLKGSGEVSGFITGLNTVTFTDATTNAQKTLTINRYGVVTGIN